MAENNNPNPSQEQSPDSFDQPKPEGGGSKKTYNLIVGALTLMALIVVWSLSGTDEEKEKKKAPAKEVAVESRNLMPGEDAGRGLAASFPKPPEKSGLAELPPPKGVEKKNGNRADVQIVGPPPVDEDEEERKREEQQQRRKKREAYYSGLGSNIMVRRSGDSVRPASADSPATAETRPVASNPASGAPDGYDPAADIDKEGFFARADAGQWRSPHTRETGYRYELKTGAVIPGMMVTGLNSDLPGNIIAQVSQNIYDSATGNHLLIPQGSKIYGAYDSRVVYGQSRALVAWNRIIFPDGSAVTLGAMPGSDMSGYAGFTDKVDNHYLRIFGSAFLMSLITGGMSYAMDKVDNSNNSNSENNTTMQDEMASALAAQMGQTTMKMLEKNISIKPTIEIRPGFRFNIVVTKDVVFRGPYVAWQ